MAPIFLSHAEILEIHQAQISRYGGSAGLRDAGVLDSAIAQPMATFGGQRLHADLFEMAAAYLFHIVENHPFVDGNKRTGTVAARVFLLLNDYELKAPQESLVNHVLSVASGNTTKAEVTDFLRENSSPIN